MEMEQIQMKIILLGEASVGKSAVLHRFRTGKFDDTLPPTLQAEMHTKEILVDDMPVKVTLWDTVGTERYKAVGSSYFRNVAGVLLLYDVTNSSSFMALSSWVDTMRQHYKDAPILIVGNKNEEDPRRKKVTLSMVHNFAQEGKFDSIEISAKTGENVEEAFQCLVRKICIEKRAATAKKVSAKGFSYLTEKDDNKDDVIKLTKDATIQTEQPKQSSWCSC